MKKEGYMEKEQIEFDSGKKVPEIIQIIRDSMQSNYEDASSDVLNYMKFLCEKYNELFFNNSKANSIELAQMYVDFLEYAKSVNLSENDVTAVSGRIQEYFENVVFEYSLKKGNEYTYSDGTDVELKIASLFLKKREPIVSKLFNKGILNDVLILAQNSDNRVANFLVAIEEISRNSDRIDLIEDPIQKSKEIAKTCIDFISGRFRLTNVEVRSITRAVQKYLVKSGMSQRESAIFITDELFKMYDKWNPIIKREEYVIGENETFSFGLTERFPEDHFHNYIKYLLPYLKSLPPELKKVAGGINFYDVSNAYDLFWESEYDSPNFYSCATSDYINKTINVFSRNFPGDTMQFNIYNLYHELGHAFDYYAALKLGLNTMVSDQPFWKEALIEDEKISGEKSPTKYGENAFREDFADSIGFYYLNSDFFSKKFPYRSKIISALIKEFNRESDISDQEKTISIEDIIRVTEMPKSMDAIATVLKNRNDAREVENMGKNDSELEK